MLYLYDKAIVKDLNESFNEDIAHPVIKVIEPDGVLGLAAQIQNDEIQFPVIALSRAENYDVDTNLINFTRATMGVPCGFDNETNNIYSEHAIPITLTYALTILTTNQADMDELVREILFKYRRQYFLTITVPYESKRKIRFAIIKDPNADIQADSRQLGYIQEGKLYQTVIPLSTIGCNLIHYTKQHLRRIAPEVHAQ